MFLLCNMNRLKIVRLLSEDFIGCPFAFCRQRICLAREVLDIFEHGFLISPMDGFYTEGDGCLLCFNCKQNIGNIINNLAYLECNFYSKDVRYIFSLILSYSHIYSKCLSRFRLIEL